MPQYGTINAKDLNAIVDSFDVLKYTSFTGWEISIKDNEVEWWEEYKEIVLEKQEEHKRKKAEALRKRIFEDFENSRYDESLLQMNELFLLIGVDDEISNLKSKINDIFNIKKTINQARDDKDFQKIQKKFAHLLELNENDKDANVEKRFLDEALPLLDGSVLEKIDSLESCRDSIIRVSKLVKQSPIFYRDELARINTQLQKLQEEYERKEIVDKLNSRIENALAGDDYDGALELFENAQQYLRSENEIIVTRDQCEEYIKIEKEFQKAADNQDLQEAFDVLEKLRSINPYPKGVNLRIVQFKSYFSLCKEIENEKDPCKLFEKIKEKENEADQFPGYLKQGFKKVIDEANQKIETEKSRLQNQADEKWKNKKFSDAADSLRIAASIEPDEKEKNRIVDYIKRIKADEIEAGCFKRRCCLYAVGIAAAVVIVLFFVWLLQQGNTKRRIINLLNEVRPLIERGEAGLAKNKLNRVFIERKKIKKAEDIDQNIENYLEMFFNKIMWDPSRQSENDLENMGNRAERVKRMFREFPAQISHKWTRKAENILNLCREFKENLEAKQSAEALDALVKLKRLRGEKPVPFELLHQVSYTNDCGCPEINLNGVKFVFIKGGEIEIGCFNPEDNASLVNVQPVTKTLSNFWISCTEITILQYDEKVEADENQLNFPKNLINWEQASFFAREFGKKYGLISNLPTEAQWEYAARNGGEKVIYPWGNSIDCSHANYRDCGNLIKAVGSYKPNKFGIFDLAGNLKEWCRDVYHEKAYLLTGAKNPCNSISDVEGEKVVRGGSFADGSPVLKNYSRYRKHKSVKDIYTGFRIVLEHKQE